jgi:hypothetical protein
MLIENFKMLAIYLKDVAIIVLEHDSSMCRSIDDEEWPFPFASKFSMDK